METMKWEGTTESAEKMTKFMGHVKLVHSSRDPGLEHYSIELDNGQLVAVGEYVCKIKEQFMMMTE